VRPESSWAIVLSLAIVIGLESALPSRFSLGGTESCRDPRDSRRCAHDRLRTVQASCASRTRADHRDRDRTGCRRAGVTVRLIHDLITGGQDTNAAGDLLGVGFGAWIYTAIVLALRVLGARR
jgi:hypothetical protein